MTAAFLRGNDLAEPIYTQLPRELCWVLGIPEGSIAVCYKGVFHPVEWIGTPSKSHGEVLIKKAPPVEKLIALFPKAVYDETMLPYQKKVDADHEALKKFHSLLHAKNVGLPFPGFEVLTMAFHDLVHSK